MSDHKVVANLGWCKTEVDSELKQILEIFNQNGYRTTISYIDDKEIWIQFDHTGTVHSFMQECLDFHKNFGNMYAFDTLWGYLNEEDCWSFAFDDGYDKDSGELIMLPCLHIRPTRFRHFERLMLREFDYIGKDIPEMMKSKAEAEPEVENNKKNSQVVIDNKGEMSLENRKLNEIVQIPDEIHTVPDVKTFVSKLWLQVVKCEILALSGLTNQLYRAKVTLKSGKVKKALIRIKDDDFSTEIDVMKKLSPLGLSPEVYGIFKNGFICSWQSGTTFTQPMLDTHLEMIAYKMRILHQTPMVPIGESFFQRIFRWIQTIRDDQLPPDFQRDNLELIAYKYMDYFNQSPEELVFCHNDLNFENIILHRDEQDLTFIDYEYAGHNFALYDIANFFQEWSGEDLNDDRLPNREQKIRFIELYLGNNEDLEPILKRIEEFEALSDLHWGIWAIMQSQNPSQEIDFNYLAYGLKRLRRWKRLSPRLNL